MEQELEMQPQKAAGSDSAANVQSQHLKSANAYTPIPYNPSLQNVPNAFSALPASGNLQMCDGGLLFQDVVQSHVQGMAMYSNQLGNFVLLSHNDNTQNTGKLIGIDRSTGFTNTYPSEQNYNHPSGIQVTGDFLVWPVADSKSKSSYVAFYDLSNFSPAGNAPLLLPNISISRNKDSAAAGITYSNGSYVVAVYGSGTLDVYVSNQVQSLNDKSLSWNGPYSTTNFKDGWDCVNLLTDTNGTIYLCGFRGMVGVATITDYCDLYQLSVAGGTVNLNLIETKHLYMEYGFIKYLGGIHCRWGSGISIHGGGGMGALQLYCSARNFLLDNLTLVLQWNNFGDGYAPLSHWTNLTSSIPNGIPLTTGMGTATVNTDPNVFGLDSNGNLVSYYYPANGIGWQCANITHDTGGTPLVTSMGIADVYGVNVLGLDSDGNLIAYYYKNGIGWKCANLTQNTGGTPLVTSMGIADVYGANVLGLDSNGNLIAYYYTNGVGWQCANLTQSTGGTPLVASMGIADVNGANIFGLDSNGNLIAYYYTNGIGWQCTNLTQGIGGTPLTTSMGIADGNVFGLDGSGNLITYYYSNGSGWQCANLTQYANGTLLTTSMGTANVNGVNVFGLDQNGDLIAYYYANGYGWQCTNLTQSLNDGTTLTQPMWVTGSGKNTYVLGLDDNDNLITCWYNGQSWNWTDLSAQQYGSTLSKFLAFIDVYGINVMGLDSSGNVLTCY